MVPLELLWVKEDIMPKLNRNQLKGIVKECLLEILSEGLASEAPTPRPKRRQQVQRDPGPMVNSNFENAVQESVNHLASNSVMAEIFADTARTTLQEQIGAESSGPMATGGDSATRQMAQSDPDEVFGEAASRWASLAFAEKGPTTE